MKADIALTIMDITAEAETMLMIPIRSDFSILFLER